MVGKSMRTRRSAKDMEGHEERHNEIVSFKQNQTQSLNQVAKLENGTK